MNMSKLHPPPLRGQVTLSRQIPLGRPVTRQASFRQLSQETFRDFRFFNSGSTCYAYEAVDSVGNRKVLTEFCPQQSALRPLLQRLPSQELVLQSESILFQRTYWAEWERFIEKWRIQRDSQADDPLLGNNGPELYFLGNAPFLVMNYDGRPLLNYASAPIPELLHALGQACTAIDREHQAGQLLNDIKPDNLLFTSLGDTILFRRMLDYGSALPLAQMRTMSPLTNMVLSTQQYTSPEIQARAYATVTTAADVYSFGKTVLQILCGVDPFNSMGSLSRFRRCIDISAPSSAPIRRLQAADRDAFFEKLYAFALYTISRTVMPEDHVYDWQTDPFLVGPHGPMRLRSMAHVQQLLTDLEQAARPSDAIDLALALKHIRKKAAEFEQQGYCNSQEWAVDQRLFSDELLVSYRTKHATSRHPENAILRPEDLPGQDGCLFLEGISGSGKTVSLRWLYKRIADSYDGLSGGPARIPVFLPLERLAASGQVLEQYVAGELFGSQATHPQAAATAHAWLWGTGGPHLVLLCDGINEIRSDGNQALLLDDLWALIKAAQHGHLTIFLTGQNQQQELPYYSDCVLCAQPLEWQIVRDYFFRQFPQTLGDKAIEDRLDNLRSVLTTAQRVHDLCVPHIHKTRIHPKALPQDECRLLHDYIHSWSAKEKIHKAVCGSTAYSSGQDSGEPYGELLLEQLAQLCWNMTRDNVHYVNQRSLLAQLEFALHPEGDPTPALGSSYLTEVEEQQVLSMGWTGVLFELDGREMHIRHESYRDYLAAEYLARLFNQFTEKDFPPVLMKPIPERVLRYLVPMLNGDALQRLCTRIKETYKKRSLELIARWFADLFDKNIEKKQISDLYGDNLLQAGNTMYRLVRSSELSKRAQRRMLRGIPFDLRLLFKREAIICI